MPKLRHIESLNTARAVNFSCYKRMRLLKNVSEKADLVRSIDTVRTKYRFCLLGYVIMPNHVHLVILPPENSEAGKIIAEIKARSAKAILAKWRKSKSGISDLLLRNSGKTAFWQGRCYDHNCRTIESVREKINYCHMNPVKARLVKKPGEWEWSSYSWYMGKRDVPISIDEIEIL